MSFWAGVPKPGVDRREAWAGCTPGSSRSCAYAGRRGVVAALEPEPGMLVETVDDYRRLAADLPGLQLALDTGHLLVTGERDPAAAIAEFKAAASAPSRSRT